MCTFLDASDLLGAESSGSPNQSSGTGNTGVNKQAQTVFSTELTAYEKSETTQLTETSITHGQAVIIATKLSEGRRGLSEARACLCRGVVFSESVPTVGSSKVLRVRPPSRDEPRLRGAFEVPSDAFSSHIIPSFNLGFSFQRARNFHTQGSLQI